MAESGVRRNQFGEEVNDGEKEMPIERWKEMWDEGKTAFHMNRVHPMLMKHIDLLTEKKTGLTCFLPLCGKSLDLKWLADAGHNVIGNEVVELACRQFFDENNLEYSVDNMGNNMGKCFKSKSESCKVTIYCCDYFQLTKDILGELDCVWERGSLTAIDTTRRKQYVEVMRDLMYPSTRYLLDTFQLDNTIFAGPPHDMSSEEFRELFDPFFSYEMAESRDAEGELQRKWGLSSFVENIHLLRLK